ncbi:MAG: hypothetical protein FWH10_05980 [Oscillospiraceae bacterium]|nr:hypothetical protein [Oscillospiraceae bacterium]
MKKIFANQYNLLFLAPVIIFLQFLIAVSCFFIQAVYYDFPAWSSYVYMGYSFIICVVTGIYITKKSGADFIVKAWFAGIFLYFFAEILFFVKIQYAAYAEHSIFAESVINLWDNQPVYRLILCCSVIFLIYFYNQAKTKPGLIFIPANLILFGLVFFFMPNPEYLQIAPDAGVFDIILIEIIRESGILIYMLNMFAFSLYRLYDGNMRTK